MTATVQNKSAQAFFCGLILMAMAVCESVLLAQDAKRTEDPSKTCQLKVEVRSKIPFLEKIPLVKYFLPATTSESQVTQANQVTTCESCKVERIGVDFDLMPGHMVSFLPTGECEVVCSENGGSYCPAATSTTVSTASACAANEGCEPECKSCGVRQTVVSRLGHIVGYKCEEAEQDHLIANPHVDCERISELRAENAALKSFLEAHEALAEAKEEMFESLFQLSAENSKLQAHVEFLSQRESLHEKLAEAFAENAKLKASLELADEKHALLRQSVEVSLENERLKLQIAELEKREPAGKATRTAKKARAQQSKLVK